MELLVVFNTEPRQELRLSLCKVKGHISANFINKSMLCLVQHSFVSIIHTQQYKSIIKLHVNSLEAVHSDISSVTAHQTRFKGHLSAQFG